MERQIEVNGVMMSVREYKKRKKTPKVKKQIQYSPIKTIGGEIKVMIKNLKLLKSLTAYYHHAYKQWGRLGREIVNNEYINGPFILYISKTNELDKVMYDILYCVQHNSKSLFAYLEKLVYVLDDVKVAIDNLATACIKSGLMDKYHDKEFINGTDKRLGLRTLISRSNAATKDINHAILEINRIVSESHTHY